MCGENFESHTKRSAKKGTPPRVWGKLPKYVLTQPTHRYTPTCVGKTVSDSTATLIPKVHPHVCGENEGKVVFLTIDGGTPPRVWGKRGLHLTDFQIQRYTPTCVGKTNAKYSWIAGKTVHPHVCGENLANYLLLVNSKGTPPRVWGKREGRYRGKPYEGTPPRVWGKLP